MVTAGRKPLEREKSRLRNRCTCSLVVTTLLTVAFFVVVFPQNVRASVWVETSDADFADGDFLSGTAFRTELHGTGLAAYVQNAKDLLNWTNKLPAVDPGPRASFGFTNESYMGNFILFGGIDSLSSARNDTWEYDYALNDWVRICSDDTPLCAPPRRGYPSMAYDNNTKLAVLYGGIASDFITQLTDTWEYDVTTNTWTNRTTATRPRNLSSHRMTFDPIGNQMVLVGRGSTSMEVWTYDTTTHAWTQNFPSGGLSLRSSFALTYNYQSGHQRVILFGGSEGMNVFQDTWEYNPQSDIWEMLSIASMPPARAEAGMAYVSMSNERGVYLWGGQPYTNDTWRFYWDWTPPNPPMPVWQQLFTPIVPQPDRRALGLAYDQGHEALIMFGGMTSSGTRLDDTWSLEFAYRLDGKYISSIYNTYTTITTWQYIFWNQTPANVPPNTLIRFQVNVSNVCDNDHMSTWFGPGHLTSTYYTTPGEVLGYSGFKCFRYLVEMITYNSSFAPRLEDVTIVFSTVDNPPKVTTVYPIGFNVPLTAPIYINFSKPMDTSNVWVSVTPNVTLDSPWTWEVGNTELTITHSMQNFIEGTRYDVCIWGMDTFGNPLDHPDHKYCWLFSSRAYPPKLVRTDPPQGQIGVPITSSIILEFDKAMNTSTCWPYVTFDPPTNFTPSWNSPMDTILTLTPTAPLEQLKLYWVEVPVGNVSKPCKSKSGLLTVVGPVANPFSFTTGAISPYIVSSSPWNMETRVSIDSPINISFSRPMNKASFIFVCKNFLTGENCSMVFSGFWPNNMTISISHTTPFSYCTPYILQVWALDFTGRSLTYNPLSPNPWRFMTDGPGTSGCGPFMMYTVPFDGQTEVPLDSDIVIYFFVSPGHGLMNPLSFELSIRDNWGNELNSEGRFNITWFGHDMEVVTISHPYLPFNRCVRYTVEVLNVKDTSGAGIIPGLAPNPFSFTTISSSCQPIMVWVDPPNGSVNVSHNHSISLKFSLPINTSTFMFTLRPSAEPYNYTWSENYTNVTITHMPFVSCEDYEVLPFARGENGEPLAMPGPLPNPWWFTAMCTKGPKIIQTDPAHGQSDVAAMAPIHIYFSEPMDTSWLIFSLGPSAGTLTYGWMTDTHLVVNHSAPFYDTTWYTAWTRARNVTRTELVAGQVPNPWRFRSGNVPPFIVQTDPYNDELNVGVGDPITIEFSETIDPMSFMFELTPALNGTFTVFWPDNKTVRLTHASSFSSCTRYQARVVQARDISGNDLISGLVPNPWNFTTDCRFQIRGLQVIRVPPNDVHLSWTGFPEAQYYKVYHSTIKLLQWSMWNVIANVSTPYAILTNHLVFPVDHFYIVRGYGLFGETSNSTMGALWFMAVNMPPGGSGTYWFSLPYNTIYKTASDITDELGPNNISVIGKWDPTRQQSILYYYLHGVWRGTDFSINVGDGLWLGVVNSFHWSVNGTDSVEVLDFVHNPLLMTNLYWVGLPFTGKCGLASQLVIAIEGGLGPGTNNRIEAVGKWDFYRQTSDVFEYTLTGWQGVDFLIRPGYGIWIRITSSFLWSPELITPEIN